MISQKEFPKDIEIDESIRNELCLELSNGSRVFNDYEISDEQVKRANQRFTRLVDKIAGMAEGA